MHLRASARRVLIISVAVATGLAACGGDDEPAATPTTEPPATEPPAEGIDFVAGSDVDLGDGWTISPCEAGPPLFCARRDGETQAVIELLTLRADGNPAVKAALDGGASVTDALRAHAADFQDTFAEDRPAGCGPGYVVEPFGPETVTVGGRPGVLYGFDGRQDGRHVERALQFATIDGDALHLIATSAVEDGSCLDDGELAEFSVDELTRLQPLLARVVARSTLPSSDPLGR